MAVCSGLPSRGAAANVGTANAGRGAALAVPQATAARPMSNAGATRPIRRKELVCFAIPLPPAEDGLTLARARAPAIGRRTEAVRKNGYRYRRAATTCRYDLPGADIQAAISARLCLESFSITRSTWLST